MRIRRNVYLESVCTVTTTEHDVCGTLFVGTAGVQTHTEYGDISYLPSLQAFLRDKHPLLLHAVLDTKARDVPVTEGGAQRARRGEKPSCVTTREKRDSCATLVLVPVCHRACTNRTVLWCHIWRREGGKEGRKEGVPVCAVCSCASGVLSCAAHLLFWRTGSLCCHWQPRPRAGHLHSPKGVAVCAPSAPTSSGCTRDPIRLLSPGAHTLFLIRTAECVCVKHSRAGRMRAQNAPLPHFSLRGSVGQPLFRDSAQLAGIGGRWKRGGEEPALSTQ